MLGRECRQSRKEWGREDGKHGLRGHRTGLLVQVERSHKPGVDRTGHSTLGNRASELWPPRLVAVGIEIQVLTDIIVKLQPP